MFCEHGDVKTPGSDHQLVIAIVADHLRAGIKAARGRDGKGAAGQRATLGTRDAFFEMGQDLSAQGFQRQRVAVAKSRHPHLARVAQAQPQLRSGLCCPRRAEVGCQRDLRGPQIQQRAHHLAQSAGRIGTYHRDQAKSNARLAQTFQVGHDAREAALAVFIHAMGIVNRGRPIQRHVHREIAGWCQQGQHAIVDPGAIGVNHVAHARVRLGQGTYRRLHVGQGLLDEPWMQQRLAAEERNIQLRRPARQRQVHRPPHHLGRHGPAEFLAVVAVAAAQVAGVVDKEGQFHDGLAYPVHDRAKRAVQGRQQDRAPRAPGRPPKHRARPRAAAPYRER